MPLVFTTIQHSYRKQNQLTCNEYVLCDIVYQLSVSPNTKHPGWCYCKREYLAEEIGLTKQSIINLLDKLILRGFIEKNIENKFLRTTEKWNECYFIDGKESLPEPVKKVYKSGKESLPETGKESLPNNTNITNSIDNNKDIGKKVTDGAIASPVPPEKNKLYTECIDIYDKWIKDISDDDVGAKIDDVQGRSMKLIISYLKTRVKEKNKNNADITTELLNEGVVTSWNIILKNWYKLPSYHQRRTKLVEINSDLQNILIAIKNGLPTANINNKPNGPKGGTIDALQNLKRGGNTDTPQ